VTDRADPFRPRCLGPCRFDAPAGCWYFVEDEAGVLVDATVLPGRAGARPGETFEMAGPRRRLFFDPSAARAGIVTCGGLCPGLNDVIRALTMILWYRYGVRRILGLKYGYEGLTPSRGVEPAPLSPEDVEDIHQHGGTILGSSRGPQDPKVMVDFLEERGIDVLFTIGGDGTQRGALAMAEEIARRGLNKAVVGIPKTIDNDLSYTDRTFGFETAVAMSRLPITSAHMEAKAARNGVGLVKLMGRESGFVAAYATLASSDVNLVLVPEVPFSLPKVLAFLEDRLARKSHAVIVVAEGAGQDLASADGTDASGNRRLGDIGALLKARIAEHFKRAAVEVNVKYLDPSYTIRSARTSADDSVFCFRLAENAVHAAMAGRTAMVTAHWNGHFVHVPMEKAVGVRKRIDPAGPLWQSVLDNTGQPAALA
jgi:6-phosphofructokinase 1